MASGDTLLVLGALDNEGIVTGGSVSPATYFNRNGVATLAFRAGSGQDDGAEWGKVMPANYGSNGITITLHWLGAAGLSSNQVHWEITFERVGTAQSIDSLAYSAGATVSANDDYNVAVDGRLQQTTFAFTNGAQIDSVTIGDYFRLRLVRDPDDASDDYAGDAQVIAVELAET